MPRISKKSLSNKKANILSENRFSVAGIEVSEGGPDKQERSYAEAIFATIYEPLLILDKDFRIKSANAAFYNSFQITEEETLGKVLFELQNNAWNIPELLNHLLKIQDEEEESLDWELTYAFPAVGKRIIRFKARLFQKETGENRVLLAIEDITERKLLENRSLLSNIVDNSNDAIMSKNLDGTIISWNKSAEKIFGYTKEEMVGKNILLIIPPELHHEEKMIISKIKKGEDIQHFNTVRMTKGGRRINVSVTISPIKDAEGKVIGASKISRDITEQIITRKKIQTSEAKNKELLNRFKILVKQAPVAIAILNGANYTVEIANDSYLQLVGKEKDFIGRPIFESMPELESQVIKELLDGVMKTGKPYYGNEVEILIHRKNKSEQGFYNIVYHPVTEKNDTITGVMVVATEVTEQVMARKKIEESELRLITLIHSSPFAIGLLQGKDLIIKAANDAIINILGKGPDIIGKPYFELMPELTDQGYSEIFKEVYATGKPFNAVETPVSILRNGKMDTQYYNFLLFAQRDINNEIDGIGIIASEVTEAAQYHKKLKKSEEQFRQTADLLPDKVFKADANGRFFYLNKAWEETTGIMQDELENNGWFQSVHPDDREEVKKHWVQTLETGNDCELQFRLQDKAGTYRWHLCRAMALKEDNGKIKMWIGATTDIQEQKRKEEEKSEFISIASHELKTPLTASKLYISLLEEGLSQEENSNNLMFAQKAGKSIERLELLIKELLDVQKIQHGKLDLNITTFDFNEMLDGAIEEVRLSAPDYSILKTGHINLPFKGDKDRLQQVVINLLTNAVKYSPESYKVFVNASEENGMIKVVVKDQGIGIQKENLKRVFDLYYREAERSHPFQGFGIGLSISSEIVKRHNGEIWATSEPGKGSTFYFTIPM